MYVLVVQRTSGCYSYTMRRTYLVRTGKISKEQRKAVFCLSLTIKPVHNEERGAYRLSPHSSIPDTWYILYSSIYVMLQFVHLRVCGRVCYGLLFTYIMIDCQTSILKYENKK